MNLINISEKNKRVKPPPLDMAAAAAASGDANGSGPKTPTYISRHKSEKERKIGHRRVGVGGEITYKKVIIIIIIIYKRVESYYHYHIFLKNITFLSKATSDD